MKMKIRTIAGLLMILLSVAGMIFWETRGREKLLFVSVLAAARDIKAGESVGSGDFRSLRVLPGAVVNGVLTPDSAPALYGRIASHDIFKNSQVNISMFSDRSELIPEGMSIFTIPGEWIFSRSQSLRGGDRVCLYDAATGEVLGRFRVAFPRDSSGREVTGEGDRPGMVLSRGGSSAVINSVEIICSAEDYFALCRAADALGSEFLVIAQEGF